MKVWHLIYITFVCALFHELNTNDEHMRHAADDDWCLVFVALNISIFGMLGWLLYQRNQPAAAPARKELSKPGPRPSMAIQPVPQERYMFLATNDPNIDLQPKGRDRG